MLILALFSQSVVCLLHIRVRFIIYYYSLVDVTEVVMSPQPVMRVSPSVSVHSFDSDQEKDDAHRKRANDIATGLLDELIHAGDREKQLRMQLDKMSTDFDHYKRRCAPLWEQEMKQRDSRFNNFL